MALRDTLRDYAKLSNKPHINRPAFLLFYFSAFLFLSFHIHFFLVCFLYYLALCSCLLHPSFSFFTSFTVPCFVSMAVPPPLPIRSACKCDSSTAYPSTVDNAAQPHLAADPSLHYVTSPVGKTNISQTPGWVRLAAAHSRADRMSSRSDSYP